MMLRNPLSAALLSVVFASAYSHARGAETNSFRIHPNQSLQVIKGLGFEIQSDSIGSGNQGLPENRISVPDDLEPSERDRLSDEMLKGFRYCRLAGGLYWRGLDADEKHLKPRWPNQLEEIRALLSRAGVEGISFEYWSPTPFWKANGKYIGNSVSDPTNTLRCFGPDFKNDPIYHGNVDRFLADFAAAVLTDINTLKAAGLKISMWGMQNEPFSGGADYPKCPYFTSYDYLRAFRVVAAAVRNQDPSIWIISDTEAGFPRKIGPGMRDPFIANLVDAYAVHTIGVPSEQVRQTQAEITSKLPFRPWFQNEYEYFTATTPQRCLNTVQHIMNSFQLGGNPTWFWIHALKPYKNAEASGYSLGLWKSPEQPAIPVTADRWQRWQDGPEIRNLPANLAHAEMITSSRGDPTSPGAGYNFTVNQPVWVDLLVQDRGAYTPGLEWNKTNLFIRWANGTEQGTDSVYRQRFAAGRISIPDHTGRDANKYGAPNAVFIEPSAPSTFHSAIGINFPIQIRSETIALERDISGLKPGHWTFNPYNWNAVGSFLKHLPWDSTVIATDEKSSLPDERVLTFRKPNGKLTVVISNSSESSVDVRLETALPSATWRGYRYTPREAGENTSGVPTGIKTGENFEFSLPPLTWEFWEQQ